MAARDLKLMTKQASIEYKNNEFVLSGELDFCNVMSLYAKSLAHIAESKHLIFNFAQLTTSSSAGLALMVEWVKMAEREQKTIEFKSISADLVAIAAVSGLDKIITKQ